MSLKKEYIFNTGIIGTSKILSAILNYLIIILISRQLGAYGFGVYSFAFALVGFFFIFAHYGFDQLLIKDLAKDFKKVQKYISNILSLKLILFFIIFIIYIIIINFINKNEILYILILSGVIQGIFLLRSTFYSLLRIKNKSIELSIAELGEKVLTLMIGGIVLIYTKNLELFFLSILISYLLGFIYLIFKSKNYYKLSFEFNLKFYKFLLIKAFPFLLIGIFNVIYVQMDSVMLGFLRGETIVGYYNTGYRLMSALDLIPLILLIFGYPLFAKLFKEDKNALKKLIEEIMYYSTVLIIPIIIGVYYLSFRILEFVYKFGSIESSIAFKILIFAQLFIFLTTILGQLIAAVDKQHIFAWIAGTGALLNIVLNFVLIPKFSLYGAGIATLSTYLLMFLIMYTYSNKKIIRFHFFRRLILPSVMGIVLIVIIPYLLYLHLIYIVLISAIIYITPIAILEIFKKETLFEIIKIKNK